jgi:DNA-binding LacI/PurR family transcriptional regulator
MTTRGMELSEKRRQVCDFVLKQIAAGLKDGDQIWPEHTLSRNLGVSKSTVRRAVCDLVALGVLRQQQGKGTFVAQADHPQVQALALHAIRMVGFLSPFAHYEDGFMREITLGADQALDPRRFIMVTKHVHLPLFSEADVLPGLVAKVQGLLWLSTLNPAARKLIIRLHERNFPVVLVDRYLPEVPCSSVTTDNLEVGILGTRHLIERGHRRIVHLTKPEHISSTIERQEGYTLTMRQAGLTPRVVVVDGLDESLAASFSGPPGERPTAAFCLNDSLAMSCCRVLRQLNLRIPEEVSVVGIDDSPAAAAYDPPLTTVAQPRRQMGFKAARLLERLMTDTATTHTRLLLQPSLVVRHSTASAPQSLASGG